MVAGPVSVCAAIRRTGGKWSLVQISATLPMPQPAASPPITDSGSPYHASKSAVSPKKTRPMMRVPMMVRSMATLVPMWSCFDRAFTSVLAPPRTANDPMMAPIIPTKATAIGNTSNWTMGAWPAASAARPKLNAVRATGAMIEPE